MLWCCVYLYYTALLNKARTQVVCIGDLYKFLITTVFNLFRLVEKKTLKIFSISERRKSRHKFGGIKVCSAEQVRKQFLNAKMEVEIFSYIFCSLDFKNISCTLFLLHMETMNGVVSLYILLFVLHHLFHFIACVLFLSIFFIFSQFFVSSFPC